MPLIALIALGFGDLLLVAPLHARGRAARRRDARLPRGRDRQGARRTHRRRGEPPLSRRPLRRARDADEPVFLRLVGDDRRGARREGGRLGDDGAAALRPRALVVRHRLVLAGDRGARARRLRLRGGCLAASTSARGCCCSASVSGSSGAPSSAARVAGEGSSRPGGVAYRVACAAATSPPPRALFAALPGRKNPLPIDSGSSVPAFSGPAISPGRPRRQTSGRSSSCPARGRRARGQSALSPPRARGTPGSARASARVVPWP